MSFEIFKALHIIFIVTWFAGLFYIVRLFIYFVEANQFELDKKVILQEQFSIMMKRLWYGITWPSAVLAMIFGLCMLHHYLPLTDHPWLILKLGFVVGLFIYHLNCGRMYKDLINNRSKISSYHFRIYNEVATLFLFAIVFLVVLRSLLNAFWALSGFILLSLLLFLAIKLYRNYRVSKK